jgi:glycosyltransferase involved in cell wall biosynthesis
VHGFSFLEPLNFFKKSFYILSEFVASYFRDFTILISEKDIQAGKKFFILHKNFQLIQNGLGESIKKEMLEKLEAREFFLREIPPTPYGKLNASIVGTISNLYKTKGLEYLIDAAQKVVSKKQNTIFVVTGSGDDKYKQELATSP